MSFLPHFVLQDLKALPLKLQKVELTRISRHLSATGRTLFWYHVLPSVYTEAQEDASDAELESKVQYMWELLSAPARSYWKSQTELLRKGSMLPLECETLLRMPEQLLAMEEDIAGDLEPIQDAVRILKLVCGQHATKIARLPEVRHTTATSSLFTNRHDRNLFSGRKRAKPCQTPVTARKPKNFPT